MRGQSVSSVSEWVSPWQNTVGPHSARLAASCKQSLRFPECQFPETIRKNDMQKNPALLEGRTREHSPMPRDSLLAWAPKMSIPGSKEEHVATDSLQG